MKKKLFTTLIFASILVLTACGGNDSEESTGENGDGDGAEVVVTGTNWDFETDVSTVDAGEVTFTLVNEEGHHAISIDGTDLEINGEGSDTITLEAGEYTIICTMPCGEGHEEMTAMLTVQ